VKLTIIFSIDQRIETGVSNQRIILKPKKPWGGEGGERDAYV